MLAALAIFFAVVWVLALVVMKTASLAIHLLLVLAVISMVGHLFHASRTTPVV